MRPSVSGVQLSGSESSALRARLGEGDDRVADEARGPVDVHLGLAALEPAARQ